MTTSVSTRIDYQDWLNTIKRRVVSARLRAAFSANSELLAYPLPKLLSASSREIPRRRRREWV